MFGNFNHFAKCNSCSKISSQVHIYGELKLCSELIGKFEYSAKNSIRFILRQWLPSNYKRADLTVVLSSRKVTSEGCVRGSGDELGNTLYLKEKRGATERV